MLQSEAGLKLELHVSSLQTGLSPDLQSMEQIRRIMRPTDVPDQGLLCDLLWSDPDKDVLGWGENDRGVSFTFGAEVVAKFLHKHDLDLICRAHQVSQFCTSNHRIMEVQKDRRWSAGPAHLTHPQCRMSQSKPELLRASSSQVLNLEIPLPLNNESRCLATLVLSFFLLTHKLCL